MATNTYNTPGAASRTGPYPAGGLLGSKVKKPPKPMPKPKRKP